MDDKKRGKNAKNNPHIKGKALFLAGMLTTTLLLSACGKKQEEVNSLLYYLEQDIDSMTDENTPENLDDYKNLKLLMEEKLEYYTSQNNLPLELADNIKYSIVSECMKIYLGNGEILANEKSIIADEVKQIFGENTIIFENQPFDQEIYNDIINNEELMNLIKNYSKKYEIPEELLVAIEYAKLECSDNKLFAFNNWRNIETSQSVYDNEENRINVLNKIPTENSSLEEIIEYDAIIIQRCLRESRGKIYISKATRNEEHEYDAIDYCLSRKINITEPQYSEYEKEEHERIKNVLLSIMYYYSKTTYKTEEIEEDVVYLLSTSVKEKAEGYEKEITDEVSFISSEVAMQKEEKQIRKILMDKLVQMYDGIIEKAIIYDKSNNPEKYQEEGNSTKKR